MKIYFRRGKNIFQRRRCQVSAAKTQSEVMMMLQELNEAILYFNCQGTPVKLPGIGIFSPSIDRSGKLDINLRPDVALRQGINLPRAYSGQIRNRVNIGLDNAGYKSLWDTDHPEDPLEVSL